MMLKPGSITKVFVRIQVINSTQADAGSFGARQSAQAGAIVTAIEHPAARDVGHGPDNGDRKQRPSPVMLACSFREAAGSSITKASYRGSIGQTKRQFVTAIPRSASFQRIFEFAPATIGLRACGRGTPVACAVATPLVRRVSSVAHSGRRIRLVLRIPTGCGSGTAARPLAMSAGSTIYTGLSRLFGCGKARSGRSNRHGGGL